MTNYEPLIVHAVSKLDKNTAANRDTLYERARAACIAELKKRDPPMLDTEVASERAALENAISKVEDDCAVAATSWPKEWGETREFCEEFSEENSSPTLGLSRKFLKSVV